LGDLLLFEEWTPILKITWKSGISIENATNEIIFDPQNKRLNQTPVLITHGHKDHSIAFKVNHISKYSTKETLDIVSSYGIEIQKWHPLTINNNISFDGFDIVPHNSGHVLGSCCFEVNTPQGTLLFTGDFNTENTKTMKPAKPILCDILIIESTFGSPNFVFPSKEWLAEEMKNWAKKILKTGKIPTFQTDSLGNAQEIICIFNEITNIPVVTHWKVSKINKVYESHGHKLEYIDANSDEGKELISSKNMVYITPKQLKLDTSKFVPALVSGWALWSRKKAFPLSDHADFLHLMRFIEDCHPELVLTCHGGRANQIFTKIIEKELKIRAFPINLISTSRIKN
jgi:Cft2 family RNA processing exonuclease